MAPRLAGQGGKVVNGRRHSLNSTLRADKTYLDGPFSSTIQVELPSTELVRDYRGSKQHAS